MSDVVNTPETLGVTPRFILQHNAMSRSIQSLSANAKKLTAMAMALLPADLSSRTAAFTFNDFCKALGVSIGGESFKIFKEAANECMDCKIKIEVDIIVKGKKKKAWEQFRWIIHSSFNEATGICTMTFSEEITKALLELKKVYAKINLQDLGRLQSKYALRIFEIAKSYESLTGKDGNKSGTWYFERDIPELRYMFGVPDGTYPETRDFRKYVVEYPVKEINNAGIGVEIQTEGVKQGRTLKKIRFECTAASRKLPARGRKKKTADPQSELSTIELKTADRRLEKELEHLKELYPKEFADLYQEELEKPHFLSKENNMRRLAAESAASAILREKYGIVK